MGTMRNTIKPIIWLLCGERDRSQHRAGKNLEMPWKTVDTGF